MSPHSSCRGPEFTSQPPHCVSHTSQVPQNPVPSSILGRHHISMGCPYIHWDIQSLHKSKINYTLNKSKSKSRKTTMRSHLFQCLLWMSNLPRHLEILTLFQICCGNDKLITILFTF